MAAYRRVYDSRHLHADCSGSQRLVIEYGLPLPFDTDLIAKFQHLVIDMLTRLQNNRRQQTPPRAVLPQASHFELAVDLRASPTP